MVGVTVIDCVIWPPGDQLYVPPPMDGVAVNVADKPEQMVSLLTLTVEVEIDVSVTVAVSEHPILDVAITL